MDLIEQGNVYYGFRSDKYPEVCCYAVIISARCDIANNKISKLYYLTAVDAKDWFCTKAGFDLVYAAAIKENLKNQLSNFEINILQRFALDYIRVGVDGSTENDYTNLVSLIGKD